MTGKPSLSGDFGVSLISLNAFVSFFVDGDLKITSVEPIATESVGTSATSFPPGKKFKKILADGVRSRLFR